MPRKRWRNCPGRPGYRVSDQGGQVKSVDRTLPDGRRHGGQVLQPVADKDGYQRVKIAGQMVGVATLVLEAFAGPAPEGTEACHWPAFDRSCNDLSNLRWGTHQENERDKTRQPERLDWIETYRPAPVGTFVPESPAGG